MYVYENWGLVRAIRVSTGMHTSRTLTRAWIGTVGRDTGAGAVDGDLLADYRWHLFRDLYGNILIHSTPYTLTQGLRQYDQPAAIGVKPSSHGCIRISPEDARWLQEWDPVGAAIVITPWVRRTLSVTDGSGH
jgi:lipoprotein-anchoring transpeptidase ErfK/SrfK